MRVIKKLVKHDKKTELVSETFDECLMILNPYFLSRIDFSLEFKDKLDLIFSNACLSLNYNNPFIQNKDKKAIRILILQKLLCLIFRRGYKSMPELIEEVVINREIIRKGYGNDLFYYYYLFLLEYETHIINTMDIFLKVNVPWLSFSGLDDYYADFFKEMVNRFKQKKEFEVKTKELFLALEKNLLKNENLDKAIAIYNQLGV